MHIAHRTAINGLVTAGNIPYPQCRGPAVLDISSERRFIVLFTKRDIPTILSEMKQLQTFFSYSLKPPLSLPSQLRFLRVVPSCHLLLPKCIDSFLAFPSLLIPSPIILLNFIILIDYFWQRTEIYVFPKMSRKFLGDIKPPIFNRLEANSRTYAEVWNDC